MNEESGRRIVGADVKLETYSLIPFFGKAVALFMTDHFWLFQLIGVSFSARFRLKPPNDRGYHPWKGNGWSPSQDIDVIGAYPNTLGNLSTMGLANAENGSCGKSFEEELGYCKIEMTVAGGLGRVLL